MSRDVSWQAAQSSADIQDEETFYSRDAFCCTIARMILPVCASSVDSSSPARFFRNLRMVSCFSGGSGGESGVVEVPLLCGMLLIGLL